MMKDNKRGERHIQLKNADVIGLVETLAEAKHIKLFEAAEMLILNAAEANIEPKVIEKKVCAFAITNDHVIEFAKCLLNEGYEVTITPLGNHKSAITMKDSERSNDTVSKNAG